MKRILLASLFFTASAFAGPKAPMIDNQIENLKQRIEHDIKIKAVSETDGHQLQREIAEIEKDEERLRRTGVITPRSRANLRRNLAALRESIERKEKRARAAASPSASPGK